MKPNNSLNPPAGGVEYRTRAIFFISVTAGLKHRKSPAFSRGCGILSVLYLNGYMHARTSIIKKKVVVTYHMYVSHSRDYNLSNLQLSTSENAGK